MSYKTGDFLESCTEYLVVAVKWNDTEAIHAMLLVNAPFTEVQLRDPCNKPQSFKVVTSSLPQLK